MQDILPSKNVLILLAVISYFVIIIQIVKSEPGSSLFQIYIYMSIVMNVSLFKIKLPQHRIQNQQRFIYIL